MKMQLRGPTPPPLLPPLLVFPNLVIALVTWTMDNEDASELSQASLAETVVAHI